HWLSELESAGVPCGPILGYNEALITPQAVAREMSLEIDHPTLGRLRTLGTPLKMSGTPLNPRRRPSPRRHHLAHRRVGPRAAQRTNS
ncbi:MAG: hypothetical protein EBY79_04140, partial [Actinobacteria bacterium]|nr:hypothetical protein [Actinomycetota bacterium]